MRLGSLSAPIPPTSPHASGGALSDPRPPTARPSVPPSPLPEGAPSGPSPPAFGARPAPSSDGRTTGGGSAPSPREAAGERGAWWDIREPEPFPSKTNDAAPGPAAGGDDEAESPAAPPGVSSPPADDPPATAGGGARVADSTSSSFRPDGAAAAEAVADPEADAVSGPAVREGERFAALGERIALLKTLIEASGGGGGGAWRLELASLQGLHGDAHIALADLTRRGLAARSGVFASGGPVPGPADGVGTTAGTTASPDVVRTLYGPAGREAIAPAGPGRTAAATA